MRYCQKYPMRNSVDDDEKWKSNFSMFFNFAKNNDRRYNCK